MKLLSNCDIQQVSGGNQAAADALLQSMKDYSFYSTIVGGGISGIYALANINATAVTVVGTSTTLSGAFLTIFWSGVGFSWGMGAAIGAGVAVYNELNKIQ